MHTIHQPDPTLSLMNNNGMDTPAWLPRAVIAEVNLMHATPAGTIDAAISTLDYFADLGVNCLWIDPINEMGHSFTYPNGYTNIGLDTVEPALSGTDDYAAGWREFARFVDAAHERGLRVLLDVVTWGVSADIDVTRKITVGGERLPIFLHIQAVSFTGELRDLNENDEYLKFRAGSGELVTILYCKE